MSDRLSDKCNPHPDAPHGFDRNSSATEDRYVCDCEHWMPPDDLRDRIAAVVAVHRDQRPDCSCGWESWEESWDMHLADAVIRELKLTEESGNDFAYGWKCPVCARGMEADHGPVCNQAPPVNLHRYVTEWTADE